MHSAIIKKIEKFFHKCYHLPPERITLIQASGSGRLNVRIQAYGLSYIATYGEIVAENEAFIYLSKHFTALQLLVPAVLHVSADRLMYIQEDAGVEDLFSRLAVLDFTYDERLLTALMERAIDILIKFQWRGDQGLEYNKCFPGPAYTQKEVITDLEYFYNSFCIPAGINVDFKKLSNDFFRISYLINDCAQSGFMHRDYQSRNILLSQDKWTVIDFQGGRKGPGLYDAISLLYQSRLQLPNSFRKDLLNHYCNEYSNLTKINVDTLKNDIPFIRLNRLLQVLGAYGKRGLIEKKSHFIASIAPAIDHLNTYLSEFPEFIKKFPYLMQTIEQIISQKSEILCLTKS